MRKPRQDARVRIANFIDAFDREPNGTKAAIAIGLSPKSAAAQAARMLKRPDVQAELMRRRKRREERTTITVDDTVLRLATIARADLRRAFSPKGGLLRPEEWPDDLALAIQSVDVTTRRTGEVDKDGRPVVERVTKIRLEPRKPALDSIMRYLGGFDGRRDEEGKVDEKPALSELEFAKMICFMFEELRRKASIEGEAHELGMDESGHPSAPFEKGDGSGNGSMRSTPAALSPTAGNFSNNSEQPR